MINNSASVYTDFSGFGELRAAARKDSSGAIKEVARQFEGMFLQMMLKSMRDASLGEGILDNNQTGMVRDMYDQQLALSLAGRSGIGLGEALERQLGRVAGVVSGEEALSFQRRPEFSVAGNVDSGLRRNNEIATSQNFPDSAQVKGIEIPELQSPQEFVHDLMPHARQAAEQLGVKAEVLVAQAALESGWGNSVIRSGEGRNSHNVFGIKAGADWQGDRVWVNTLEYEGGVPVRKREPFRAYDSYQQSFDDYAEFISSNPRYKQALDVAGNARAYTQGLQDAGYATDPDYAQKIMNVLGGRAMETALAQTG